MTSLNSTYLAFAGDALIAKGSLSDVAIAVRGALDGGEARPVVVMNAATAEVIDLDLRGSADQIAARYAVPDDGAVTGRSAGPGRPRLGVVSREVSLLPRHWDWLRTQRGGASATLRRLVEDASRASAGRDRTIAVQEAVDRYLRVMAGDRPHYEEALRAFYAGREHDLRRLVAAWPPDIRAHLDVLLAHGRDGAQP